MVDEEFKRRYEQRYQEEKERGVRFFPDIIMKDVVIALGVFVLLAGLAIHFGVPAEPPADPNDSSYIPRPEWYFLWLFQLLKYFPGQLEWVGTTLIPLIGVLALLLLPFYDRSPVRHWRKRKLAMSVMAVLGIGVLALTVLAAVTTPPQEEFEALTSVTQQISLGEEIWALECVECHGVEGEGGEITTVEGLEGVVTEPLNAPDFIYTRTDDTIFNVVEYGQQDLGMPPYGLAYGGELERAQIDSLVTFMRYTWDDRVEIPADEFLVGGVPELGPDEIPTYVTHVEPLVRRACLSCHRPGKENNNYLMGTYEEILETGDNAPNLIAGDPNSIMIRSLHREETEEWGPMPPSKPLREDWIEILERWVLAGMPRTPEDIETAE